MRFISIGSIILVAMQGYRYHSAVLAFNLFPRPLLCDGNG